MAFPDVRTNSDGNASAAFAAACAANGVSIAGLNAVSQLQLVLANLLTSFPPVPSVLPGSLTVTTWLSVGGDQDGVAAFAGDRYSHVLLALGFDASGTNPRNPLVNPHQVGAYSAMTGNSYVNAPGGGPTGGFVAGFETAIGVKGTSITLPRAVGYSLGAVSVSGSGTTVQRTIGVMSNDETVGTSGNAFIADFTDSVTFVGNWFFHYSGALASYLGGALTVVGAMTTGADYQFANDGFGLLSSDAVRFIRYTTASGTQLDTNNKALIVAHPSIRNTIGANGAATALTANPLGYLDITIGATSAQIPYYTRGA